MPKSLFYKIYFAVVAVFVVALTVSLICLSGWLENYEAGRPESVVENAIETYIKSGKFCEMRDDAGLKLSEYESYSGANDFFEAEINGKEITYASISKRPEGVDESFGISADGTRIMNLYLKKDDSGKYKVTSAEFEKTLYKSVRIAAPADAEITVNGTVLDKDLLTDLPLPEIPARYMSDNMVSRQYADIEYLLNASVSVTVPEEFSVDDSGDGVFAVSRKSEDGYGADITEFAVNAAKAYSNYLQKDGGIAEVRKYLSTDTDFYKKVSTSYITYVAAHTGFRFDDVSTSELHKFSDNLYSCRVRMTHVLISANEEHKDFFDKYVYIYKSGNTLKVIDMQIYAGDTNE